MTQTTIRVTGLTELQAALKDISADAKKELRLTLKEAAEPVRSLAAAKAGAEIRNLGPRWGQMKVGATNKVVYVAPKSRRRGGSPRPNLAPLLMDRAMQPALDASAAGIYERVDLMLDVITRKHGF
jgi:hypothetical protein